MRISNVELSNFRKLLSVRLDFSQTTTLFVGANNSGKTSAIVALRRFLVERGQRFSTHDFTVSKWKAINDIGINWITPPPEKLPDLTQELWAPLMPTLDLWLDVQNDELHYVNDFLPTLDWTGGLLGVRLRLEPRDTQKLYEEFLRATAEASKLKIAAPGKTSGTTLSLWPTDMMDFLNKRLRDHFAVRMYALDPAKLAAPAAGKAQPQALPPSSTSITSAALWDLIRVDEINAQRGFGDLDSVDAEKRPASHSERRRLSEQLRIYYQKHLDPSELPDSSDLGALEAIEVAQNAFNDRLRDSFAASFAEVEGLGYPGVTDPKLKVSTRLKPEDGLNHEAAVAFEVDIIAEEGAAPPPVLRLPEDNNGLGYQNLISMVFKLMSFRDAWMRVGKAGKAKIERPMEPLHLVLLEEPEAHLHAQVQQVFINKAYQVLRAHNDLGEKTQLRTQLVVSTHSSHVAHEISFEHLRYFRRLPAGMGAMVPTSAVVNLSNVFGATDETKRFVTRYLRAQHADLFFADAAILVEGPAEKMLVPNFIRAKFPLLDHSYITLLEIGGSHAHKLRPLLEHLGLLTLVITDIDAGDAATGIATPTTRGQGQRTNNATLSKWLPEIQDVDGLLAAPDSSKVRIGDALASVRVAYQSAFPCELPSGVNGEAKPSTFEDALVMENLQYFSELDGFGLVKKFKTSIAAANDVDTLCQRLFEDLRNGNKAEFALEVIGTQSFDALKVPRYIADGLTWLEDRLRKKQAEILPAAAA